VGGLSFSWLQGLLALLFIQGTFAQGIIVNEISNGDSGNREYIELVVIGDSCSSVDLRGYIIDDNNGASNQGFSSSQILGGVSLGYIAFDSISQWQYIPVGTIIVIYNESDKNPAIILSDDSTDTNPTDNVYVLAGDNSYLKACSNTPSATGTSNYSPCTSTVPEWAKIGFRNLGDAAQIRKPDKSYFHGISYGTSGNNMTGGQDSLNVHNADGIGDVFYFDGNDFRDSTHYSVGTAGTVDETPGWANSSDNEQFIDSLLGNCLLPIKLLSFSAVVVGATVLIKWRSTTDFEHALSRIQRSSDGINFYEIGSVPVAGGNERANSYQFTDGNPLFGMNYYKLIYERGDSDMTVGNIVAVEFTSPTMLQIRILYSTGFSGELTVELQASRGMMLHLDIFDILGRKLVVKILELRKGLNVVDCQLPAGGSKFYFLRCRTGHTTIVRKFKG